MQVICNDFFSGRLSHYGVFVLVRRRASNVERECVVR